MTVKAMPLVITAIFACVALGQTPADQTTEQVFPFTYTRTPQAVQEIVNTMRSIVEVPQSTADNVAWTMTLHGTPNQLGLAAWLVPQLDRSAPPTPQASQSPSTLEYQLAGSNAPVARVFYPSHVGTPQALQEMINAIRSTFEIQRVVAFNNLKAVILRGTAEQVAAAEWLINGLDKPAGVQPVSSQGGNSAMLAYTFSDPSIDVGIPPQFRAPAVRIFYLTHTPTPQAIQELVNSVRSLTELQRVVNYNTLLAVALRGTADQVAMAEWVINALDRPAGSVSPASPGQTPATNQYQLSWNSDVARVFYPPTATTQAMQELVSEVRSTTHIQRVTFCNTPGALALRGTVGQVAMAATLIQERGK
jgi:type II secretory pathway component GspD/PulD (secretin)